MEKIDVIKLSGKKGINDSVPQTLEFSHANPNLHGKDVTIVYVNDEGYNLCAPSPRKVVLLHGGEDADKLSYYEAYVER